MKNLPVRARLFASLRRSFEQAGFLAVETPTVIDAPAPEEYIESVATDNGGFLRTSPELAMKIMLAEGLERIYQIGPCYRAGEFGRRHRAEFTMLEFYRAGWNYRDLLDFTVDILRRAALDVHGRTVLDYRGKCIDFAAAPEIVTVDEAFRRCCGMTAAEADAADRFDELMVTEIEPALGQGRLTFLIDYPANRASLARLKQSDPAVAERWEMYIDGLELANAFGELTVAAEQKARFRAALDFRASQGMKVYPEATRFFAALEQGIPESSGCALGLDRLAMIFCDAEDIGEVTFPRC